jgi:hypothetical protein
MKVLTLVVSGGSEPVYKEHKKVWRTNHHPQVKVIFIEYSDDVSEITLDGDTLLLPGTESFQAMTRKTIDSIEYFLEDKEFTHVIRTNLSSVWNFPRLITYLKLLPSSGLFAGVIGGGDTSYFVSGAGIHMSRDIADLLVRNKEHVCAIQEQDDLAISFWLSSQGVTFTRLETRVDFTSKERFDAYKNKLDQMIYHMRFKQENGDRSVEPALMREMISLF